MKKYFISIPIIMLVTIILLLLTDNLSFLDNLYSTIVIHNPYLTNILKFITQFGDVLIIVFICIMLLIFYKNKKELFSLYIVTIISTILNNILKLIFARPRPELVQLVTENTYSFPSGHASASMTFYGYLIYMIWQSKLEKKWKIVLTTILSILILITLYLYNNNINLFIKLLGNSFFLRVERLINWSNTSGMQLERGLASIGSSGLLGNGFSKNVIYFPEAHTDFIFAVFSSNFGFIGSLSLIILIIMFDLEIINIAKNSKKRTNKYICIGILGILLYQQIQNIGMTFGLLPITGITLPFISYGGSSLLSYMIMIGIIFNIHSENKKSHY